MPEATGFRCSGLHELLAGKPAVALAAALPAFARYSEWRAHRLFTVEEQQQLLRAGIERLCVQPGATGAVLWRGTQVQGLCVVTPLPWDSAHFGLAMCRLDAWLLPDVPDIAVAHWLQQALAAARTLQPAHLSTHVDSEDYALFNALAQAGFRLLDAKRTFVARRHQPPRRGSRPLLPVRPFRDEDRGPVEALAASAAFASRFSRDPLLAPRSAELYRLWMRRLLDTPPTQRALFVVERDGEVVACGGVREIEFSADGIDRRILADGVFAADRRGVGAYLSVIDALIADGMQRYPLLETRVSANNLAAVRVLESLGYSSAAGQYALHLHLPAAPDALTGDR